MVGVAHGLNTPEYQPSKCAAIEGDWENPHEIHAEIPSRGTLFLIRSLQKKCLR
jgi:cytochrome bd-type quinol oxidase subunit 1